MGSPGFLSELRRRHVWRVAVAYAVVGWALIEISSTIIPALHLPEGLTTAIVVLVLLGFPVAVVLAWAFEMTPEGVRRTEPVHSPAARAPEQHRHIGRKLDFIIAVLLLAVVGDRQAAISAPGHSLRQPGGATRALLRLDPAWDPLRKEPGFQALLSPVADEGVDLD